MKEKFMKKVVKITAVCSNDEQAGLVKYLKRISVATNIVTTGLIECDYQYQIGFTDGLQPSLKYIAKVKN
jgi:hypothetical protein